MTPAKAREKLRAYQGALERQANAEYEAAVQGYEALAGGQALLDLDEVFRTVAYDGKGRPRLAIARADRRRVQFHFDNRGTSPIGVFDTSSSQALPSTYVGSLLTRVPYVPENMSEAARKLAGWERRGWALVPMTPPDVFNGSRGGLAQRHVLWEVEQWQDRPTRADRDPYLLRHLAGSLYVVEGAWDLT